MGSEEFTEKTYWDPYSRTEKPVLTQEQVDGMWPNARKDRKDKLKESPLDDAMPSIPREQWPMDAGVPVDYHSPIQPMSKAEQIVALNVATAPARTGKVDMVNLPPHYARFKIEPIRFIAENKLDWFQGNIVKYVLRHDAKNGLEDIDKVGRYQQMYRLFLMGDPDWWKAGKPEDFKVG